MKKYTSYTSKPVLFLVILLTAVWIFVTVQLVHSNLGIDQYQKNTSELFENYTLYSEVATTLSRNFNIRSDNVKGYVATGNQSFLDRYFDEENQFASDHKLFSKIRNNKDVLPYTSLLDTILSNSSRLSDIEYHAMKLVAVAYNKSEDKLPEKIRKYTLSEEELKLSMEEKINSAMQILFGEEYSKLRITTLQQVGVFIENIITATTSEYESSKASLTEYIHAEQNILIIDGVILVALIVLITTILLSRKKHNKQLIDSMAINSTFASCYDSVVLVDPAKNTLELQTFADFVPPELSEAALTGFYDYVHYFVNEIVFPDDRNMIINKFSLENICQELEKHKSYVVTYRVKSRANPALPVYYRSEFLPYTDAKGNMQILCGGSIADAEIRAGFRNEMNEALVESLATLVENRDLNTGNHIQHTRHYVSLIIKELKKLDEYSNVLSKGYADTIITGSVLHDVGKIYISDTILNKPGKLSPEEFDTMKKHTEYGSKVINDTLVSSLDEDSHKIITNIVLHHHERWDGKGYPYGLKGTEIPLSARIMAVADVFDALVSKRSYKEPFSIDKAFEIIEEEKGTHFDSQIVDVFLAIRPQIEAFLNSEAYN